MLPLVCALAFQGPTLKLPAIFSDNMVLQRDIPISFYGTASPGQKVRVQMGPRSGESVAGSDGNWAVKLRPVPAGGPYTASVSGDTTLRFKNILVGEVWVASGQSNMEWRQNDADDLAMALREADPHVRMFNVEHVSAETPQKDLKGTWMVSGRSTVPVFSAVANAFANQLHKTLGVPVGIIHTSWGGTPAESWTSREALLRSPALAPLVNTYLSGLKDYPERKAAYDRALAEWNAQVYHEDLGNVGYQRGWANSETDISDWHMVKLPNTFEKLEGPMDGAVWYRKTVEVPAGWGGKNLILELGAIDDFDVTYVNGRRVGATDDKTPLWYMSPRRYRVPAGLLHQGMNVIAVRVFDHSGNGGFTGNAETLRWGPEDKSTDTIGLAGDWLSKVEVRYDPPSPELLSKQPQPPFGPGNPWAPGGLYNAMIAPLLQYPIRGAIWYQGESNANRAYQYRELFPSMIHDWRNRWGVGEFPFYFVQLANFTARNDQPVESDWAELREAQAMTLALPNTGMAVTIDIGEANDIHPKNKREVGRRLALNALAKTYALNIPYSGPMLESISKENGKIRVHFRFANSLATSDEGPVQGFAIAGEDRVFHWAQAKIDGPTVIVWSPEVPNPVAVRYGWSNNPAVNLVNGADLPASPFRTDSWPGVTQPKKG